MYTEGGIVVKCPFCLDDMRITQEVYWPSTEAVEKRTVQRAVWKCIARHSNFACFSGSLEGRCYTGCGI